MICKKCGNKGHIHKYFRSKKHGSNGDLSNKSKNEIPEWVTKRYFVSDTKYTRTATMTLNSNKYKWYIYLNNVNDV